MKGAVRKVHKGVAYPLRFGKFSFGSVEIDRVTYTSDVLIDRGEIQKRKKKRSRRFRKQFDHTPISIAEKIPWKCRTLVIGTGNYEGLPVMKEVKREAKRRKINLVIISTGKAIKLLSKQIAHTNAILHVTC